MKREIFITDDGSTSIRLPDLNVQYHSTHGAIQETYHVFIKNGLDCFIDKKEVSILEIGFGTGLNAFVTLIESEKRNQIILYTGVEKFPVNPQEIAQLNYIDILSAKHLKVSFNRMHTSSWEKKIEINSSFLLTKKNKNFKSIDNINQFDLIYFDAFGAGLQPELWTLDIFNRMYTSLKTDGVLVTYSAKGSVRRNMIAAGFTVERLEGPIGKREMLRGVKRQ